MKVVKQSFETKLYADCRLNHTEESCYFPILLIFSIEQFLNKWWEGKMQKLSTISNVKGNYIKLPQKPSPNRV